jgi:hypothetical protein
LQSSVIYRIIKNDALESLNGIFYFSTDLKIK